MSTGRNDDQDAKDRKDAAITPSEQGIALCLGQLADEAAELGLAETFAAIRQAIGTCLLETADRYHSGPGRIH